MPSRGRIVFVCDTLRVGGSQSVVIQLVRIAQSSGFDVVVASRGGPLAEQVARVGARVVTVLMRGGIAGGDRSLIGAAKTAASAFAVAQLAALCSSRPTVVHASQPWPVSVGAAAALVTRRPLIWHAHGTTPVETPPASLPLVRRAASVWVGITPEVEDALRRLGPDRKTVIRTMLNPIDLGDGSDTATGERTGEIGVVSTLTTNKTKYVLACLAAARQLAAEGPVHLRIVGDGPERERIKAEALRACASTSRLAVTLHGSAIRPWSLLRTCEIVVGMGLVALEAAIRGHNVVVASSDGLGGRFSVGTFPALSPTNFTGRSGARLSVDELVVLLRSSRSQGRDPDLPALIRARHGHEAARAWVALWDSQIAAHR